MGLWTERVVPRIANKFLDNAHVRAVRERKGVRVWQVRLAPINRGSPAVAISTGRSTNC